MPKQVKVTVWLDEFDQLILEGPRGKQAVVPESDAGSVMDELFPEDDGFALAENESLVRHVPREEYEFWLPTGGGHVRNPRVVESLTMQSPETRKRAAAQVKKRVKFGRMTLISDLWDDNKTSAILLDGEEVGEIVAEMKDIGMSTREMRVASYVINLDWLRRTPRRDVHRDARKTLTLVKKLATTLVASHLWHEGWRPRGIKDEDIRYEED